MAKSRVFMERCCSKVILQSISQANSELVLRRKKSLLKLANFTLCLKNVQYLLLNEPNINGRNSPSACNIVNTNTFGHLKGRTDQVIVQLRLFLSLNIIWLSTGSIQRGKPSAKSSVRFSHIKVVSQKEKFQSQEQFITATMQCMYNMEDSKGKMLSFQQF